MVICLQCYNGLCKYLLAGVSSCLSARTRAILETRLASCSEVISNLEESRLMKVSGVQRKRTLAVLPYVLYKISEEAFYDDIIHCDIIPLLFNYLSFMKCRDRTFHTSDSLNELQVHIDRYCLRFTAKFRALCSFAQMVVLSRNLVCLVVVTHLFPSRMLDDLPKVSRKVARYRSQNAKGDNVDTAKMGLQCSDFLVPKLIMLLEYPSTILRFGSTGTYSTLIFEASSSFRVLLS